MTATGTATAALDSLPHTRRKIIEQIKKHGDLVAQEVATNLGVTVQAARQHLTTLERDGLVSHHEQRDGLGRPRHRYVLTPSGDALFPRNYADLTNELLEYVHDEDPEMLARIFDRRAQRRLLRAQARMQGLDITERVRVLAEILDEDGYLAEFQTLPDDGYLIIENNCAVLSVALRYGHACSSELDFLRAALPDTEITRVAHRIRGGHVCAYRVCPL